MHVLLERFIISSTPAWRVLLAVFFSAPFFVILLVLLTLALGDPGVRAGLNVPIAVGLQWMTALAIVASVALSLWLWPRRDHHEPQAVATLLICQVIGLSYTLITIMTGTFTSGTNMVLLGALAVGLMLFERGPMLVSYVVCVSVMLAHDVGVMAGWWAYAPAYHASAFQGAEPAWWFDAWRRFVLLAGYVVLLGLLLLLFARLDAMHAKLTRLSYTDALTGLANRRRFMDVLQSESARQVRSGTPLSLVLIDADHFKLVNDQHGHVMGDEVLRELGRLLMACVRTPTDLACRLGGEEFALILPETSREQALTVCNRLREQLAAMRFGEGGEGFGITVSMGLVQCSGPDHLAHLRQADQQLYRAKSEGRNQVCMADSLSALKGGS